METVEHRFVTLETLNDKVSHLETKIENSNLRNRNWVLAGVLAVCITLFGGFTTVVIKIDSITGIAEAVDQRKTWLVETTTRDRAQDDVLRKLDPSYVPIPYGPLPK